MVKQAGSSTATHSSNGHVDPAEARDLGLIYSNDEDGGIARKRSGRGFRYLNGDGGAVADEKTLERIQSLVIPPAWTDVWISASPRGHIQATGRDAKGRKQYRYHPRWRNHREESKFGRLVDFACALPTIRAQVESDLHRHGLPREKVLAAVVALLERTRFRVGNDEYARSNKSFGLTTLQDRHVDAGTTAVRFKFRGKSGKEHTVTLHDRRLARIVKRCQDLPGQRLFVYEDDDGVIHKVGSADVNSYLREITGADYTAKDFRTWAGTVIAASVLRHLPVADSEAGKNRDMLAAVDAVAEELGNTRAVARQSYIHPAIFEAYEAGTLQELSADEVADPDPGGLDAEEQIVLAALSAAEA
jgi:DNA topoisomerase-1